jgi:hypothetical protein
MHYYTQCRLENIDGSYRVAWIPEVYAVVDKELTILDKTGWTVTAVYMTKREDLIFSNWKGYRSSKEVVYIGGYCDGYFTSG